MAKVNLNVEGAIVGNSPKVNLNVDGAFIGDSTQKKSPNQKATASSGEESSTGIFSDIASYFATAKPMHSGMGAMETAQEVVKKTGSLGLGLLDKADDRVLSNEEKIATQKRLKQRAALDEIVTSSLLSSNAPTLAVSFLADKLGVTPTLEAFTSGAVGTVAGTAVNLVAGAADFLRSSVDKKSKSSEGFVGSLYEAGQNLQSTANAFMRDAKVEKGVALEDVDKSFTELLAEGKTSAFTTLGLSVIQQLPQIIALGATGGSAAATFAGASAMGAGSALGEEYAKDENVSGKDAVVAIAKGAIEGLTESIFRTDIQAINSLKKMITKEGKEEVKDAIIRGYGGVMKKALSGANEEGVEEIIANVGGFIVDRIASDKFDPAEYNKLVQSSVDAFILGAASGGVISGAAARGAMTPLTEDQKSQIKRYKEVAENPDFSEDIRNAASAKVEGIIKESANKTDENYGIISAIENVNKRAEAIQLLNDIKTEEASQKDLHDESLIESSNAIIDEKQERLDNIIVSNAQEIYGRTEQSQKDQQKRDRERAANYLAENNFYDTYTQQNSGLIDAVSHGEEVDIKDVNRATSTLYDLEASVLNDDKLTNQERNYVLRDIYSQLNKLEAYDNVTKDGVKIAKEFLEAGRTARTNERVQRVKKVRNERFNNEVFRFETPEGKQVKLKATVNEKGDVVLSPLGGTVSVKTKTETKSTAPTIKIKGQLEVGDIERNEDGDVVSAKIKDTKTNSVFTTTNEELINYLQTMQQRSQNFMAVPNSYSVGDDIESVEGLDVVDKLTPNQKVRYKNYFNALKSINPNAQVVLYATRSDMAKGLASQGVKLSKAKKVASNSNGLHYKGVSHIVVSPTSDNVVVHEIFHQVISDAKLRNSDMLIELKDRLVKMLRSSQSEYLTEFVKRYDNEEGMTDANKAEEFLAELSGALATKMLSFNKTDEFGKTERVDIDFSLNRSFMQKFFLALREFVQKYAEKTGNQFLMNVADMVGKEAYTDEQTAQFFESFGKSLREGKATDIEYLRSLGVNNDAVEEEGIRENKINPDMDIEIDALRGARESLLARTNQKLMDWVQDTYKSINKKWFERNYNLKKKLEDADMLYAMHVLYNKAGASQLAQLKFAIAKEKIYGGLTDKELKLLDSMIHLRRVIAIDTNFDNQREVIENRLEEIEAEIEANADIIADEDSSDAQISTATNAINELKKEKARQARRLAKKARPMHGLHNDPTAHDKKIKTNRESAEATLDKIKELVGEEFYNQYNERADLYFKEFSDMLKYKLDNGLIDQATYDMFKNYDYQPRNFLRFSYGQLYTDSNGNQIVDTPIPANSFTSRGSLTSSKELQNIERGDMDYLEADSAKLLQAALITAEIRVSTNKALKALAESSQLANYDFIREAEYELYKDGTIKKNADGSLMYKTPSDPRFTNMVYKVDGKKVAFQLINTENLPLVDEFNDVNLDAKRSKTYRWFSALSGSRILRAIATGINVAFPITNIPIDVMSQIHLTDIYVGNIGEQYKQAMAGTLEMSKKLLAAEFKYGDASEVTDLIFEFADAGGLMMTLTQQFSPDFKGKAGKVVDFLGTFGNISELASKLNAYKTVRDRLVEDFYRENGYSPQDAEFTKIKAEAAYRARAAMDYHRGGEWAKFWDGFSPYFNVMMQVAKISTSYITNNPKAFLTKISGAGAFVMGVTMYNMMVAGDDYDNDDVQRDLINNLVIFNPFKNEDGTRGYTKIAVPATVKFFLNVFQSIAEGLYVKEITNDTKREEKLAKRNNAIEQAKGMFMPRLGIGIPPVLKGVIEYSTNYDMWKGQQIYDPKGRTPVSPYLQGVKDKNVAEIFKVLADTDAGKYLGLSPVKSQKFMNDILPMTNPLISVGYSLMDKSVNAVANLPESYRSKFDKNNDWTALPSVITDAVKDRYQGVTDPNVRYNNKAYGKINTEEADKLFVMHDKINEMVDNKASFHDIREYAKSQGREYVESMQNYAMSLKKKDKIEYKIYEFDYFAMAFAPDARAKAEIMIEFERTNKIPDMQKYRKDLRRFGILSANVQSVYDELKTKEK